MGAKDDVDVGKGVHTGGVVGSRVMVLDVAEPGINGIENVHKCSKKIKI